MTTSTLWRTANPLKHETQIVAPISDGDYTRSTRQWCCLEKFSPLKYYFHIYLFFSMLNYFVHVSIFLSFNSSSILNINISIWICFNSLNTTIDHSLNERSNFTLLCATETMRSYYIKMKVSMQFSLLVACQQLSLCAPSICYRRPLFSSRSRVRHILICALFDYFWTVEQKHPCHYKSWKMCNITQIWLKSFTPIVTVHGFPVPSSPCLWCVRVRVCEQVSVGVCDWGSFAPAESHHHGLY